MSRRHEYTGPRREWPRRSADPWPPPPDEPHPHAYAFGYLIGRAFATIIYALIYMVVAPALYVRSLFGRKPPRPVRSTPSPYRWVWWFVGISLALIFWQPLLIIVLLILGTFTGHITP